MKEDYHKSYDESGSPSGNSISKGSSNSKYMSQLTISTHSCISQRKSGKKLINNYLVTNINLGRGAFAKVKEVLHVDTKEHFAMKVIDKKKLQNKRLSATKSQMHMIEKEKIIMKKMGHPYIIKLIEIIDDPDNKKLYLIQELIKNKDLQIKIDKSKKEPMSED